MRIDELTEALHDIPAAGSGVDPGALRRRGRTVRNRRRAGVAALTLAVAGGGVGIATALDHDPRTAGVATGSGSTLTTYEKRVLDAVPGSYAVAGTVVVPGPVDPDAEQNLRLPDGRLSGVTRPLGFHGYTDPGYLQSTVDYPQIVERRQFEEDRTGMDVVADNGPVTLGCILAAGQPCSPAVLVGDGAAGWTYLYGLGTDDFLQPGSDMEVFLDQTYSRDGAEHSVIGGFPGTDARRVVLVLVDGTRKDADLDVGVLSEGNSMFWAETKADVAKVIAYDDSGDVVTSHEVRDCTGGVDCEVR